MAAYAALLSLMNNIEQIQRHTRLPISLDNNLMESLHEKVSFLIDFLESYNSHGDREEMKDLESRITDAAYAAEDIIETHVVDTINTHSRCIKKKRMNKIVARFKCILPKKNSEIITNDTQLLGIEKVLEDMDFIKEEAMKIKDKSVVEDMQPESPITARPSSSSIHFGKDTMVGFGDKLIELMERLTGHESSCQIIPIVGMGGMGKTTLAKTAYDKPLIVHYFDFRVWVSISQEYSLRKILVRLLGNESTEMSEQKLGERLYKSLCGRRYLVVLDDMWSIEAWEMVKVFFPDYKNGSRVVVTTRISSLATYFGWCNLEMNFLDEDKGWDLLCEKVFGLEGCPHELEEVGRKIVKNCQGLPLSIVVIGGLLAKSVRRKEYWESIARDTKGIINLEGDEQCMKILSLSYHNLPIHLKPCFLYMGMFPEDSNIRASLLIKLWVAEGFLKPNSSKELEVVGEEYLNDLINRNLILVHKRGLTGKMKSCMIHDLLRDICLKEAQNGKFMYATKMHSREEVQCIGSQRRISIPRSSHIPKHLYTQKPGLLGRSLLCDVRKACPLKNFRLLRVLKASNKYDYTVGKYSLGDTFKLVNSRFIEIETIRLPKVPSSICLLWNLQILIVRGLHKGPIAPLEIWEMTELRHLQIEYRLYLSDPPPSQEMNRRGDVVMKKLQTLKEIKDFRCNDEMVKRIPNIQELKIYYEDKFIGNFKELCLNSLGLLKKLESLSLWFKGRANPIRSDLLSNLAFPTSLKKLTLYYCNLPWEDMTMIGSLPHLEVLKLRDGAFIGPEWVTVEGEFCCLKYLQIYYCLDLVHWESDSTHFPCLEHLVLWWLPKLVEIPSGIGEIPTLESIRFDWCSNSSVISAKKILEEQEDLGNVGLRVHVVLRDKNSGLESLASDNFIVGPYR